MPHIPKEGHSILIRPPEELYELLRRQAKKHYRQAGPHAAYLLEKALRQAAEEEQHGQN